MSRISRQTLICALILIFLSSACGLIARPNPTPVWTVPPDGPPVLPTVTVLPATSTPTSTSVTPLVPITGEDTVSIQCQFCVEEEAHTMLVFPDFVTFDVVSSTPVTCLTADVVNGQRIVICRGTQSTSFNLNICSGSPNCLQFQVALQSCPLFAGATPVATNTPYAPVILTPVKTIKAPTKDPTQPTGTATPLNTPTLTDIPATSTPVITSYP